MELISSYFSEDGVLEARVYKGDFGHYVNQYLVNNRAIRTESYEEHGLQYHEDAAENFVMRVKKVDDNWVPQVLPY